MSLFGYLAAISNNTVVPNRQYFQISCGYENSLTSLTRPARKTQTIPHSSSCPYDNCTKCWQTFFLTEISHIFVTFFGVTIKISCIVHKNVSVYCVEFMCAKKQSILLLEVWRKPYYSEYRRFILSQLLLIIHKPQWDHRKKKKKCKHLGRPLYCLKVAT